MNFSAKASFAIATINRFFYLKDLKDKYLVCLETTILPGFEHGKRVLNENVI